MNKKIVLLVLSILLSANKSLAFQNCQSKYDNDKRSLPELRGMCNVCHISPNGGGPQNEFGSAYKTAGFMITDELVAKFPNLFQKLAPSSSSKPEIKRIKPKKVTVNIQSMVSIIGKNFVEGTKAIIDSNEVLTTFKSNMLLIINFVLDTVGLHELKVQNPDGQESNVVKIMAK